MEIAERVACVKPFWDESCLYSVSLGLLEFIKDGCVVDLWETKGEIRPNLCNVWKAFEEKQAEAISTSMSKWKPWQMSFSTTTTVQSRLRQSEFSFFVLHQELSLPGRRLSTVRPAGTEAEVACSLSFVWLFVQLKRSSRTFSFMRCPQNYSLRFSFTRTIRTSQSLQ